jgi:DNA polymerase-3 subunit gamma/tau
MAVREIDGASHNSVDNVRELIDSFRSPPAPGYHYKVYIIDEVHMLSTAAFNALLKSLEEPPSRTVFILATTEVHKIPQTVLSRCQRHDFRSLSIQTISERLSIICGEENIEIEPEAVRMLARLADGSMRDSQSLLERVQSYGDSRITAAEVSMVLGIVERGVLLKIVAAIVDREPEDALRILTESLSSGLDIAIFLKEFVSVWRDLLVMKSVKADALEALGILEAHRDLMTELLNRVELFDLNDLVHLAREGADSALRSSYPKYVLEALVVRLASRVPVSPLSELVRSTGGSGGGNRSSASSKAVATKKEIMTEAAPALSKNGGGPMSKNLSATDREPPFPLTDASESQDIGTWADFVTHVERSESKIFAEQLKRLVVASFSSGILAARGPDFTVGYLLRKDCLEQLRKALLSFSKRATWDISIMKGEKLNSPEHGSLAAEERRSQRELVEAKRDDLVNHPVVKGLQRLFPGSEIEAVKVRGE